MGEGYDAALPLQGWPHLASVKVGKAGLAYSTSMDVMMGEGRGDKGGE